MEERLNGLKHSTFYIYPPVINYGSMRLGALDNAQADDDGFDVAVEDAISEHPTKGGKGASGNKISTSRDKKSGYGGAGKRSKQNGRASTDNFDSGPGKGGRRGGGHEEG